MKYRASVLVLVALIGVVVVAVVRMSGEEAPTESSELPLAPKPTNNDTILVDTFRRGSNDPAGEQPDFALGQLSRAEQVEERKYGSSRPFDPTFPPISLASSDFGRWMRSSKTNRRFQLAGSRIVVVDDEEQQVTVFDPNGAFISSVGFRGEGEQEEVREFHPLRQTIRTPPQILQDRVFLSSKGQLHVGNSSGAFEKVLRYSLPVHLVGALNNSLILAFEEEAGASWMGVADVDGRIIEHAHWSTKLVEPKSADNSWANEFFPTLVDDNIVLFYRHYPIVRIYDLQGNLLEEVQYEMPPDIRRAFEETLPLAQVAELGESLESWYSLVDHVKTAQDGRHWVVYNSHALGILDRNFRLAYFEEIFDLGGRYSPRVLGIDTDQARLLVATRSGNSLLQSRSHFGFHPISLEAKKWITARRTSPGQ